MVLSTTILLQVLWTEDTLPAICDEIMTEVSGLVSIHVFPKHSRISHSLAETLTIRNMRPNGRPARLG